MAQKKISLENLIQYDTNIKKYITNKIAELKLLDVVVVDELPTANISSTTLYLVKRAADKDTAVTDDASTEKAASSTYRNFTEYLYVNSKWEEIGEVDFYNYYTKDEIDAFIADVKEEIKYNKDYTFDFNYLNKFLSAYKAYDYKGNEITDYDYTKKHIFKNIYNGSTSTYVYIGSNSLTTKELTYLNDNFSSLGSNSRMSNGVEKIAYTPGFFENLEIANSVDVSSTSSTISKKKIFFYYFNNSGYLKSICVTIYYDASTTYTASTFGKIILGALREAIYARIEDANVAVFKTYSDTVLCSTSTQTTLGYAAPLNTTKITTALSSSKELFVNHANYLSNSLISGGTGYFPIFLPTVKSSTIASSSVTCNYLLALPTMSNVSSEKYLADINELTAHDGTSYYIQSVTFDTAKTNHLFGFSSSYFIESSSTSTIDSAFKKAPYLIIGLPTCVNGYIAFPSVNIMAERSVFLCDNYSSTYFA